MQDIMNVTDISFPHLGIYLNNVPKSFSIFGFQIAFYGVIIGIGVLCGVLMAAYVAKKENLDSEVIWDFAIYAIVFSIIGARVYYVIFQWDMYKDNLINIFNLRNGGLAIYGAVIAAFITLGVYCKIKKYSFLQIADICVPGLVLGQVIGRWGNFTNREVFGEYTDNLLAMRLPIDAVRSIDISENLAQHIVEGTNYIQVHPTFLYESLWNLLLLVLMLLYGRHKKFQGEMWLLYLGGYGLGRAWIEGIRTDTLFIPHTSIAVSQVLAIVLFVAALAADILIRTRMKAGKIWAVSLTLVVGTSVSFAMREPASLIPEMLMLAGAAGVVCLLQFYVGRKIGRRCGDKIVGAQGLGQKNTVLAIWMALSWLDPLASIAPAAYIAWQNTLNSLQLYYHAKVKVC